MLGSNRKIKYFLLTAFIVIFAIVVIILKYRQDEKSSRITLNGNELEVDIARSKKERSDGLSGRDNLCGECGMLFVFPGQGEYSFHMRGMNLPLDILWINEGKVVYIKKEVPKDFPGIISPEVEADMVLEINAGKSEEWEIGIGSKLGI